MLTLNSERSYLLQQSQPSHEQLSDVHWPSLQPSQSLQQPHSSQLQTSPQQHESALAFSPAVTLFRPKAPTARATIADMKNLDICYLQECEAQASADLIRKPFKKCSSRSITAHAFAPSLQDGGSKEA